MIHVDEGALQALLDGELSAEERYGADRHLEGCAACRAELNALRSASGELAGALSLLDRRTPRARGSVPAQPRARPHPRAWRRGRSLARAAVLVLGFAAAASATIPGSPVRGWLGGILAPERETVALSEPAGPGPAPETRIAAAAKEAPDEEAGISVLPAGGEVRIVLRRASPELVVRAVLVDRPRAGVFARGDAASARFGTGAGRIEVEGAGPGELRIELPRAAYHASVVVNGTPYLTKRGDQMRLSVPAQDSMGAEVTFRVKQP